MAIFDPLKAEEETDVMIDSRCAKLMRKVARCSQCLRYRECLALGESSVYRSRRKRGLS